MRGFKASEIISECKQSPTLCLELKTELLKMQVFSTWEQSADHKWERSDPARCQSPPVFVWFNADDQADLQKGWYYRVSFGV